MVLWLTLLFGIISRCDAVTYQLSAVPEKVAIGQTLTITAKLLDPTSANTDLRIHLTQPGMQTLTLFQYRTATGCIFLLEPYISTGTVVSCEPANSRYVIRFQSVIEAHVGTYTIFAPFESPSLSSFLHVQLLVNPTSVTITPSRREVIEYQATNFVCTVDDQATMPVSFIWKRIVNGNRVNPPAAASTIMIPSRSNRLSWNSVSRQHAGQHECRASNEVGQLTSQPATLVVYYPATSVTLTTAGATTVSVGTPVTFTCTSTGGNPHPSLVILDGTSGRVLIESVQSSSSVLTYGPISMQKSANGARYRCKTKATVSVGSIPAAESNALTLDVQFPPNDIKVSPQITVDEGQSTTVRCETTTSSNPMTELTWTGLAVGQRLESTSLGAHGGTNTIRTMTLTGDRTRNGATYTCTATHLEQQIYTKTTKLDVNFAPNAIAFYDTLDTSIPENQERVMRCRTETSKPAGTIVWRKMLNGIHSVIPADPLTDIPGDFGGTVLETEITIQPSRHDNGGKYWCEVDYTYTNGTKVTRRSIAKVLDVHYPVEIGISVNPGTNNIHEGDPITLTCATSGGNPQTIDKYSWSHNDNILVDESERTLSLNPVQYDQGGRYSCSATNKGGTSAVSTTDIDVKYKPRLDPTVADKYEIGAMVGESVTFSLTILANPAPTSVKWTAADGGQNPSSRFIQTTDGNVYSLEIKDISHEDFTTYQCRVVNIIGLAHFLVTLKSRGPPETPSNFVASARSYDTITLHWTSEFSGADNQTFLLEQIKPEWGVNEFELADPGIGSTVIYDAKNLEPATSYTFRLRSRNDLGLFSPYTKTTAMTKPLMYASSLDVRIVYIDLTTVAVTWKTDDELIRSYRNATVRIQYTPVRFIRSRRASNQRTEDTERMGNGRFTAMFLHGSAIFDTPRGVQEYSFDVIVIDNDGRVVLSLSNLKADRKNAADTVLSFGMPMIITLSVLGLVVLISVSIVVAICCRIRKLKSRLKTALKSPEPSTKSPTATSDNAAFEEENPYMIPHDADPAYYHYSGNKYAVAGKPDVNDVTDNDYDVIRAPGEGDHATIGDDRDKYDAMDDEAGYVDMSGINNNQDEKSVPENEYIEIDDRRNKKRVPENEYMEMKINDLQSKKSVPEDEYVEMHSPAGCKMPK